MDIYWLEQNTSDVPRGVDWLSNKEIEKASTMRFPKRRSDWILGRWTAKMAVHTFLGRPTDIESFPDIEIRGSESGAPEVLLRGKRAHLEISLSHSNQVALCVLGAKGVEIGCDVESVEVRSTNFVEDYFTAEERAHLAATPAFCRAQLVNILWSAKESVLKALHVGLRASTQSVSVVKVSGGPPGTREEETWWPLAVLCADGRKFRGFWREADHLVRTVVYPVGNSAQLVALQPFDHFCGTRDLYVKSRQ